MSLWNRVSGLVVFFSSLEDKNNIYTMAYLLTNASRNRASQNHADHHVWSISREEYIERMKTNKTSDGIRAYERVLRDPSSIDHKFDPNCEQCDYKRRELAESRRREAEEAEQYRIRQEEEKAKKKEKEREANERRMMAAEDKPKTPPPPKKKATSVEIDALRKLKEQEEALMAQVARIRAEANKLKPVQQEVRNQTRCDICNVEYMGNNDMYPSSARRKAHLATRKHQINAGLMTADVYPRHCDTCDYDAKTKHAWEQHCDGKKHIARSTQTVVIPTTTELENSNPIPLHPSPTSAEPIANE